MKRIGFDSPDDPEVEQEEKANEALEALKVFIQAIYKPYGSREQLDYKTSMVLKYELREMVETSLTQLTKALGELDYKIEIVAGAPLWVMYSRESPECFNLD